MKRNSIFQLIYPIPCPPLAFHTVTHPLQGEDETALVKNSMWMQRPGSCRSSQWLGIFHGHSNPDVVCSCAGLCTAHCKAQSWRSLSGLGGSQKTAKFQDARTSCTNELTRILPRSSWSQGSGSRSSSSAVIGHSRNRNQIPSLSADGCLSRSMQPSASWMGAVSQ